METNIERPQSVVERSDFILLGTKTIFDIFNAKLASKAQEYVKKRLPFDEPCARLDFRDKIENMQKESQRIYGFVNENLKLDISDLDKYGKESRFDLIEDQENKEDILVNGLRTSVISGHTLSYKCKDRGHGIAVYIPIEEYKARKK